MRNRTLQRLITASLTALGLALAANQAAAAVPPSINHQGRLYDAKSAPVNATLNVVFTLYDAPDAAGKVLWTETHSIPFDDGYYSVELGKNKAFGAAVFDGSVRYLGIQVGNDPEMTPRSATRSVPYALVSSDAIGDINPSSVSIPGFGAVIDKNGKWVGDPTGLTGPAGAVGPQGPVGVPGKDGAVGPAGPAGLNGAVGAVGPAGPAGLNGAVGPVGPQGPQGPAGSANINGASGNLVKFTAATTGGNSLLFDTGTGIGLGTNTNNGDRLYALSPSNSRISLEVQDTGYAGFRAKNSLREYFFGINTATDRWVVFDNVGGVERLSVASTGNVGVNQTAPQFTLDVNGTAGKPGGGAWSAPSDARLKTDVVPFADGLDVVMQVQPVVYRYTGEGGLPSDRTFVGVIAQDLQKVAPYMVSENYRVGDQTYLSVDPSALDYVLVNAVQEQQKTIAAQKQEIAELREDLAQIKAALGLPARR